MTRAFTLIELLVVVTIIVLLVAMLIPSMEAALVAAQKAVCATNQKSIHTGSIGYVQQNRGYFFICRGRDVQLGFDTAKQSNPHGGGTATAEDRATDWLAALASAGLATAAREDVGGGQMHHKPLDIWTCPTLSQAGFPIWDANRKNFGVSYQYFGGIENWRTPGPVIYESASPLNLATSRGGWALTAELTIRMNGVWLFVPHPGVGGRRPSGGNHAYIDGSVVWFDFDDLYAIHGWNSTTVGLWRQTDLGDYGPPTEAMSAAKWE